MNSRSNAAAPTPNRAGRAWEFGMSKPKTNTFPVATRAQKSHPSQLELHVHEMLLAIIHQLQRGTRLFVPIQKNLRRHFPGA